MGRIVEVVAKQDNGWWKGMVDDESGWFPASYVKKIDGTQFIFDFVNQKTIVLMVRIPQLFRNQKLILWRI